ncbi:MAG: hypothetical protein HZB55_04000 [Deltaproteobacteria bacterium]|nr:hypothetical protein [Deltaproteobacteria bacterium]
MSHFFRAVLLALLVVGGTGTAAPAAAVAVRGLSVDFAPPPGWVPPTVGPGSVLGLYRPVGVGAFPHLVVTEGEAGTVADTLWNLGRALPQFFQEQGIEEPRLLRAPRAAERPDRVELAYSGRLGEVACDWFQLVLPGKTSGLIFTFALPSGTLGHWQGAIDAFTQSLRVGD